MLDVAKVDAICEHVSSGDSQRRACEREEVAEGTFRQWKRDHSDVATQYARACEERAHHWAEEFMEIADDGRNDWMEKFTAQASSEEEAKVIAWEENGEALRRSQLRIDARKWMMARILPKQFGDRQIHQGDEEAPIAVRVIRGDL